MTWPPPTADEQVDFLQRFQRLLAEGSFVATYKYALLQALADLTVERPNHDGAPLTLSTRDIAGKMIELYWRQAAPFPIPGGATPLLQNAGAQAAIIRRIVDVQAGHGHSLAALRRNAAAWRGLLADVDQIVRVMPLWKLQRVGTQVLDFLYPNVGRGSTIELRPGVAYCLRAFHGLITDLIRGAWLRHVRRVNLAVLGEAADLSAFLFGSERANLAQFRPLLLDIQSGACFYCMGRMQVDAAVDHFVPWARYPSDLGHNFVLAHPACNGAKSDHLAAERHLEAWLERNEHYRVTLVQRFDQAGVVHDLPSTLQIAAWAYSQTARAGGQVWIGARTLEHLSSRWTVLLPRFEA